MSQYSLQVMHYDLIFNNNCTRFYVIDVIFDAYV